MTFTDDDLKRLKEELIGHDPRLVTPLVNAYPKFNSLLARLDAESQCAELLKVHYEAGTFDDLDEGDIALIVQALEARRKSKGEAK